MIKTIVNTRYENEEGFTFTCEPIEASLTIKQTATGYEARYLTQDYDAQSPQEWGDDKHFLVGYHRDFTVDHNKRIDKDLAQEIAKGKETENSEAQCYVKAYHIFGLEAYIHSGVALALAHEGNFCDRQWDVSQLGLVFVAKEEWKTRDKAREAARGLVEEWNRYLSGDVYCIVKETYNKNKNKLEHDICGGYYGNKHALEALKTDI